MIIGFHYFIQIVAHIVRHAQARICLIKSKLGGGFKLSTFNNNNIPPYVILSHIQLEEEEVVYNKLVASQGKNKASYAKLCFCRERAVNNSLNYFWVDTCYINKWDNNKLSIALNSIFRQYQHATKCYIHLLDIYVLDKVTNAQVFQIIQESVFQRSQQFY